MRRTLLVVGVFLAAGAIALPAVAVRAATDQSSRPFPGGRYFVVGCGFSHRNNDDAIALSGQARHVAQPHLRRQSRGRRGDDARSLLGGATSCGDAGDSSAYWVPTLFVGRRPLRPLVATIYDVRRTDGPVRALPGGAEDDCGRPACQEAAVARRRRLGVRRARLDAALRRRARRAARTSRSATGSRSRTAGTARDLDSEDHKRHVAYSVNGRCPGSHPVALPTLLLILLYPSTEFGAPLQASGRYGAHGDFINGWNPELQAKLVEALELRRATIHHRGAIAQLGERLDRTQEVGGSSPPSSHSKNRWKRRVSWPTRSRFSALCFQFATT